ncbi:MAG: hypothetical protein LBR11_12965 [Deltaproteobacteria bacterium]|nr:hypothetical protein [Deltaproteobacteria bacterium]
MAKAEEAKARAEKQALKEAAEEAKRAKAKPGKSRINAVDHILLPPVNGYRQSISLFIIYLFGPPIASAA